MSKIPYISGLKVSGQVEFKNLLKLDEPLRVLTLDDNNNVNWSDYIISSGGTGGGDLSNYYTKFESNSNFYPLNSNPSGFISSVNWSDVIGRPTALSQFINNLGNYGNWITAAEGSVLFQPKENQRLSTTNDVSFNSISSTNYVSGLAGSGFKLFPDGSIEVDSLTVRKDFNINTLVVNKINASNGSIAVTDGIKITDVVEETNDYRCSIPEGENTFIPFQVDDIVRCQVFYNGGVKYYQRRVTFVASEYFKLSKVAIDGSDIPEAGDEVVRFGNISNTDRQGLLYLTASDTNAPYLDVLDGVNSASLFGKTKVRLGKLDGITSSQWGTLSGYGLYAENVYLQNGSFSGTVNITGGNAATKSYADTSSSNAQSAAIASAVTLSNQAKIDAETASKNYADAKDALQKTILESYSDGLVDAEEQRAINDAQAKLIQAQNYAETKKAEAIAAAALDASTKVDEASEIVKDYADSQIAISAGATLQSANNNAATAANNARIAAEAAAAAYSQAVANSAATQAEINAAANALYVANQKRDEAINSSNSALSAFVSTLKSLAYSDIVQIAQLGDSVMVGGYLKNTLIDTVYLKAALINAQQIVIDGGGATTTYADTVASTAYSNAVSDATSKVNAIKVGGANLMRNTYNFSTLDNWYALGSPFNISGTFTDGTPVIHTGDAGTGYGTDFLVKGNTEYIVSTWVFSEVTFNSGGGNQPIHLYVGTTAGSTNVGYTDILYDQNYPVANQWKRIYRVIKTGGSDGQDLYMRFHCYAAGFGGTNWYWSKMYVAEGNKLTEWQPSALDAGQDATSKSNAALNSAVSQATTLANNAQSAAISSANSTALSYAQTYANIAEGNAINSAANTAQAKADAAYTNAVNASNSYAVTQASAYATQAEINSAADASLKATNAYNNAVAAAASAQATLVSTLKSLAYQDIVEISKLGSTIIQGGMIKTDLLNADYIKASIINASYIYALDITARTLAATSGTIANWVIGTDKLYSGNNPGNYIELQSGTNPQLYMRNAAQVTGEYSLINSSGVAIISNGNSLGTSYGNYNAVGAFKLKSGSGVSDVSLYLSAPSSSNALICEGNAFFSSSVTFAGSIFTDFNQGVTTQLTAGGARMKFVNGLYVGYW